MEHYSRIISAIKGKFKTGFMKEPLKGYKLNLGFGRENRVGIRDEIWVAVPEEFVEELTKDDIKKHKAMLKRKKTDVEEMLKKLIKEKNARAKEKKSTSHYDAHIKKGKQKLKEIESEINHIKKEHFLEGKSIRLSLS